MVVDPVTLSTISVILALVVLVENTIGLWKIVQAVSTVQRSVHEGISMLQREHRVIIETLERISNRLSK